MFSFRERGGHQDCEICSQLAFMSGMVLKTQIFLFDYLHLETFKGSFTYDVHDLGEGGGLKRFCDTLN